MTDAYLVGLRVGARSGLIWIAEEGIGLFSAASGRLASSLIYIPSICDTIVSKYTFDSIHNETNATANNSQIRFLHSAFWSFF